MEEQIQTEPDKPEPEPKIIGLTGGIGSGKTTVAAFIEEMGFPVYYSDIRAKEIVNEDENLKTRITELLGSNAYDHEGRYHLRYVADRIFSDDDLLRQLNAIIHPAVRQDFGNWVKIQSSAFVFKETALLFELKLNDNCFKSILVTADERIRMKRVMDRDGKTYREVESIMLKQLPEKDKLALADYVIYNNEGIEELRADTERLIHEITEL